VTTTPPYQAVRAAHEHGDKPAEGLALLRKSFVARYGRRDPGAGLRLAQHTAHTTADASQVLTGLAMLHVAEAHAMLGDRRACDKALDAASSQFTRIQPGDPAIDLFSPSQHGRLAGSCYLFLRDAKGAAAILDETAQALRDHSKSQAVVLGRSPAGSVSRTSGRAPRRTASTCSSGSSSRTGAAGR
jgi:hypothetical protein